MDIKELRTWVEVEYKQADHNARESQASDPGFYHIYNTGRAAALRKVMEKIDVLMPEKHNHNYKAATVPKRSVLPLPPPEIQDEYENGPSLRTLNQIVDRFNMEFPVGTKVMLKKDTGVVETVVQSPASILGGHSAVGWFQGVRGCYSIEGGRVWLHESSENS